MVEEPETHALRRSLAEWQGRASSELARVELTRVARRHQHAELGLVTRVLASVSLVPMTSEILDLAERIEPVDVRSLDAIHVATALSLGADLGALVTYDRRMQVAARAAGVTVLVPA